MATESSNVASQSMFVGPGEPQIWRKLRRKKASRGRFRPAIRIPTCKPNIYSIRSDVKDEGLIQTANTLSVVAALLATITFAAPFTIPGGFKSDAPNVGSPLLIHKPALTVFLLSDIATLYCSMLALLVLTRATTRDKVLLRTSVEHGRCMVYTGIYIAMIAFISGLYVVISIESKWLAILVCIIGSSFHFALEGIQYATSLVDPVLPGRLLRRQITRP